MSSASEHPIMRSRTLLLVHDIPIHRTKVFWDGLREGRVHATKCTNCGAVYYPPQPDCSSCLTSEMTWIHLSEGLLETFTKVYLKPQGFLQYEQNYVIAIARTPQNVKVMGWLEGVDVDRLRTGMPVEISAKVMPDNFPVIIFKPKEPR